MQLHEKKIVLLRENSKTLQFQRRILIKLDTDEPGLYENIDAVFIEVKII